MSHTSFSVTEVAERLRLSRCHIFREIKSGAIAAHRVGRALHISPAALAAYIASTSTAPERRDDMPTQDDLRSIKKWLDHIGLDDLRAYPLAEVAEMTGLSLRGLQDGARQQRFAHLRIGNRVRMTGLQIRALLKQLSKEPAPQPRAVDSHARDRARAARRSRPAA